MVAGSHTYRTRYCGAPAIRHLFHLFFFLGRATRIWQRQQQREVSNSVAGTRGCSRHEGGGSTSCGAGANGCASGNRGAREKRQGGAEGEEAAAAGNVAASASREHGECLSFYDYVCTRRRVDVVSRQYLPMRPFSNTSIHIFLKTTFCICYVILKLLSKCHALTAEHRSQSLKNCGHRRQKYTALD